MPRITRALYHYDTTKRKFTILSLTIAVTAQEDLRCVAQKLTTALSSAFPGGVREVAKNRGVSFNSIVDEFVYKPKRLEWLRFPLSLPKRIELDVKESLIEAQDSECMLDLFHLKAHEVKAIVDQCVSPDGVGAQVADSANREMSALNLLLTHPQTGGADDKLLNAIRVLYKMTR